MKSLNNSTLYLAEQAVKEYYRPRKQIAQMEEVEEFCRQHGTLNLYQTFLRLQRLHIDRMIVGTVLANLPELEQQFMRMHYQQKMGYYWISVKLSCSQTILGRMNKRILQEIQRMLFYALDADGIFHRLKVMNMLRIIDIRIVSLSRLSHKGMVVKQRLVDLLVRKRQNYRQLLDIMQECVDAAIYDTGETKADVQAIRMRIINAKLSYPHSNVAEISQLTGISKPTVSRRLRQYMIKAYECIR